MSNGSCLDLKCVCWHCMYASIGRYQYFTSGIQYYKFITVFGIPWYFDLISAIKHIL